MVTNVPPKSAFVGPETEDPSPNANQPSQSRASKPVDTFETIQNEVFDKDNYVKICDPNTTDTKRQLRCFKLTSRLGRGGQAWTFRGKRDSDKENRDTVCQAYKHARGQQLAEGNGKGFSDMDPYLKKAKREALEILSKKNGSKELKSKLEEILKQKNNVCIRVTGKIIDQNARHRIDREITTAGILGPNIIPVYNYGTVNGRFVFVMPLVKNASQPYGFGIDAILDGFTDIANGLKYMHERGMIHRDVKPENMLFITSSNNEKVKGYLIDFGLMKILGDEETRGTLTNSSMIAGTIPFCSPEQAVALRKADEQSDIYSFGASLYKVLTWEDPNPIDPAKQFDTDEANMEYHRNLITKYRGDVGDKATRPQNINRKVTFRDLFETSVRTQDFGNNKSNEITSEDVEDNNISFCSGLRKLYLKLRHNRKYHRLDEKLKHLELAIAAMMHPGERDKLPGFYTRYYRYQSMQQVIEDLENIKKGEKPANAYAIVQDRFKKNNQAARERFIREVFSDYCPYSERAVRGLSNPAWYTKAACFIGPAVAGGLLGAVADKYLQIGEKLQPIFNTVYEFLSTI